MPTDLLLAREPLLSMPRAARPEALVVRLARADVRGGDVCCERGAGGESERASAPVASVHRAGAGVVVGVRLGGAEGRRGGCGCGGRGYGSGGGGGQLRRRARGCGFRRASCELLLWRAVGAGAAEVQIRQAEVVLE